MTFEPPMTDHRMRVSDADRERAAQQLQKAFAEGRITPVELDERLELVFGSKTYGDLTELLSDLPGAGAIVPVVVPAHPARGGGAGVEDG